MEAECWKCKRMNPEKPDGYYWCAVCSIWYLPLKKKKPVQRFLDDEEDNQ